MFFAFALIVGGVVSIGVSVVSIDVSVCLVVAYNIIMMSIFFSIIHIIFNANGVLFVIILINILIITGPVAV